MNEKVTMNTVTGSSLIKKILFIAILTISGGAMCYVNIFDKLGKTESIINVILACVVWAAISYKLSEKFIFEKLPALLSLIMTLCTVKMTISLYPERNIAIILLSSFSIFLCLYLAWRYLYKVFANFVDDKSKKKTYFSISVILLLIVALCYAFSPNLYEQYDYVFSMDSGWVLNHMYPELNYYDVRHPLSSIFFFPIYATVSLGMKFFRVTSDTAMAVLIHFFQCQFIILTSFILEKLTDNKWAKYIYLLSGPVILSIVFLLQSQILWDDGFRT